MDKVQDDLKLIRSQLRLAMNGVTSTSMREKGVVYKLNFGVPYPEIKEIARIHEPNASLAAALWREDIREFKLLATFLQPAGEFPKEDAFLWVKEIPYLEIAEACSRNLFVCLPYLDVFISELVLDHETKFARTVAFLVWAELFKKGGGLNASLTDAFKQECMRTVTSVEFSATWMERQAAAQAMRFYGRQSDEQAREILGGFDKYKEVLEDKPELREIYNDLKFEFDYYR